MRPPELEPIAVELRTHPAPLYAEFQGTEEVVATLVDADQLVRWAQEGAALARQAVRSWEAAAEYFKASPQMLQVLAFPQLLHWAESGASLSQASPTVAAAFFRCSPRAMAKLAPRHVEGWAGLGRSLTKGTWKSNGLAARFFESSPDLLTSLSYRELELFAALIESLAGHSYDLASECLDLGQRVFPTVEQRESLISLATVLAQNGWREVRGCFDAAGRITSCIEPSQRNRFILLAERLARHGMNNVSGFMLSATQSLARMPWEHHRQVVEKADGLVGQSQEATFAFLKSIPRVMELVSPAQVDLWYQQGVEVLQENLAAGIAYFKLESTRSEQVLDTLSSSVELDKIKPLMGLYCLALTGAEIDIQPTQQLADRGVGWVSVELASTDGTRVFLPPVADRYPAKVENFAWFKVMATHQVSHLEFRSFEFRFDDPSALFDDLRPRATAPSRLTGENQEAPATDMTRFFDLFPNRRLASDVFTVVEDARLDFLLTNQYRGIAPDHRRVQTDALTERPPMQEMPLQQAMVEFLVRLSLNQFRRLQAPKGYLKEARAIAALLRRMLSVQAEVEDSAEATLRIYHIISHLPSVSVPPEEWQEEDFDDVEFTEGDVESLLSELSKGLDSAEEYESPPDVDFRGEFKPEMVQLMLRLKRQRDSDAEEAEPISQEALEELLRNAAELDISEEEDLSSVANNLMKEARGIPLQAQAGFGYSETPHEEDRGGPLDAREPLTAVYNEWDFRAHDYRPRWCKVHEKEMAEGELNFFSDTIQSYGSLLDQIRREMEAVRPEMFRKIKRLREGEDVDLDAAIEAVADIRGGHTPDGRVYWRRNKIERDIGVAFLLDLSASTAEAIEEAKGELGDWNAPSDPSEYAVWLRTRRGEGRRRQYKRIIDVERESLVLLMTTLEAIGDCYAVYGFSGYGRENVEFYVIKEFNESLTDPVRRRLDKVTPLHATRMGPAIRHATSKLERWPAKTKFLFVISDGRPQDRGYSREREEKEYAVQDTRQALLEAQQLEITPFCLTVDKQGHDYMRTMAADMGYEVLTDIAELPRRLPYLYRRITL